MLVGVAEQGLRRLGRRVRAGPRGGGRGRRPGRRPRRCAPRVSAGRASSGSVGRAAAQSARWPPAECPTEATRFEIERARRGRRAHRHRRRRPRTSRASRRRPRRAGTRDSMPPSRDPRDRDRARSSASGRTVRASTRRGRRRPPDAARLPSGRKSSPSLARVGAVGVDGASQCARQDSNLRPRAPEARALSPELRARERPVYRRAPCRSRRGGRRLQRCSSADVSADVHGPRHDRLLLDDRSQGVARDRRARARTRPGATAARIYGRLQLPARARPADRARSPLVRADRVPAHAPGVLPLRDDPRLPDAGHARSRCTRSSGRSSTASSRRRC